MVGVFPAALPDFVAVRQRVGRPEVDAGWHEIGVCASSVAPLAVLAHVEAHFLGVRFLSQVAFVLLLALLTLRRVLRYATELSLSLIYFCLVL